MQPTLSRRPFTFLLLLRVFPSYVSRLLVIIISLVVNDVEELELVNTLGGGDDTQPVTELHLLQELLGPAMHIVSDGSKQHSHDRTPSDESRGTEALTGT